MFYMIILGLVSATLYGCLAMSTIEKVAKGEPTFIRFVLSASADAYEITRWWDFGQETLSVLRQDLPIGCDTARFFLNDSAQEIQIAQPTTVSWVTGVSPPLPDESYPPCALLVSYGSFTGPPALKGLAVTSAGGLVAISERKQPHPAVWVLFPVGIAADFYILIGAVVTMPVWAPIGLLLEYNSAKCEHKANATLPQPVAACWTKIDCAMKKGPSSNSDHSFSDFKWVPGRENAYFLTTADEAFTDENPLLIDTRVTLCQGRVQFNINHNGSLWTDADVECGLQAGEVVATRVNLRK
jgi:hypothetical protein